jgi:hypothetical protein
MTAESRDDATVVAPAASQVALAFLRPLTVEARQAVGCDLLGISGFPFRVGRETRQRTMAHPAEGERRTGLGRPSNDLYLADALSETVSREHLEIDRDGTGFLVRDRDSLAGTVVEGTVVGGGRQGGTRMLRDGDVIVVGGARNGLVFKFLLSETARATRPPDDSIPVLLVLLSELRELREELGTLARKLADRP